MSNLLTCRGVRTLVNMYMMLIAKDLTYVFGFIRKTMNE